MSEESEDRTLTPEELSARWRGKVSVGTLKQWRHKKRGPGYRRIGNSILYPLSKIVKWEQDNTIETETKEST